MSIRTEITKGEGAATGFRSLLSSIFLFFLACGIGVVLGEFLTYRMLDISAANPLTWGTYIISAGGSILGLMFFFLTPSLLLLFVFSTINTYVLFVITVLTQVLMVLIVNEELNIPLFCLAIAAWFAWQASRYYRKRNEK